MKSSNEIYKNVASCIHASLWNYDRDIKTTYFSQDVPFTNDKMINVNLVIAVNCDGVQSNPELDNLTIFDPNNLDSEPLEFTDTETDTIQEMLYELLKEDLK